MLRHLIVYGEVNKTYHLKGNLAWGAQQRFTQVLEKQHTERETHSERSRGWNVVCGDSEKGFFFRDGRTRPCEKMMKAVFNGMDCQGDTGHLITPPANFV